MGFWKNRKKQFTFLVLWCFLLPVLATAQEDTIPDLVISEQGGVWPIGWEYLEFTNMGDTALNMADFQLTCRDANNYREDLWMWLSEDDYWLEPDSSWLVAMVYDLQNQYHFLGPGTHPDILREVDRPVHRREYSNWMIDDFPFIDQDEDDSVDVYQNALLLWQNGWPYRLFYGHGNDSILIDQVAYYPEGVERPDHWHTVAGVPEAYTKYQLFRKTTITEGNTDWDDARGMSLEDSEWLPVPDPYDRGNRYTSRYFTTLGRHGEGTLDDANLSSEVYDIDWENQRITVPWGIHADSVMEREYISVGNNLAWHYRYSSNKEDSLHNIVVTGDTLAMYALGADLERVDFVLEQGPANEQTETLIFPTNVEPYWAWGAVRTWTPYYVTQKEDGEIDSVLWIDFAERVDTLFKYLEKGPSSSWEIVWVDGQERADVKWGDNLKVTAESGATKEYFLAVDTVPPRSSDAALSAITWPDAPDFVRQNPVWHDDTIPGFSHDTYHYTVGVPYGTATVPALSAIPRDVNGQVSMERATRLTGPAEYRTTTITVVAEDDAMVKEYKVTFKQFTPREWIQPLRAEPIISEIVNASLGDHVEIFNPGDRPLDLSDYMLAFGTADDRSPADVIQNGFTFDNAYKRYVFGYKYTNLEAVWQTNEPGFVEQDYRTDPIIGPGETFVFGQPRGMVIYGEYRVTDVADRCNVILGDDTLTIPTETPKLRPHHLRGEGDHMGTLFSYHSKIALFKITNDSIKAGLKGVNDPADFELVDLFGDWRADANWSATKDTIPWHGHEGLSYRRKPEISQPNPKPGVAGSWGVTDEESEWTLLIQRYWYPDRRYFVPIHYNYTKDLGNHTIDPVTFHLSTIMSLVYKVSDGYRTPQTIEGVVTGTTWSEFEKNIIRRDEGQTFEFIGAADTVANEDTLEVTSADSSNVTKYVIRLSDEGLSDDAVLTAAEGLGYTISHEVDTGVVKGIPFGTTIGEVKNNVVKPEAAKLNILEHRVIDTNGVKLESYGRAPLKVRNYDTVYVETMAHDDIYFEVVAEDMQTKITYQLNLDVADDEVYAYSDLYDVDQHLQLVTLIPTGTNVETLFTHLRPTAGASIKVVDKVGAERELGEVKWDDEVIVTSADSSTQKIYRLTFKEEPLGTDAYVVSDVLGVDQVENEIWGIQENIKVSIFLGLVTPAPLATLMVLDDHGEPFIEGSIGKDFDLKVTSCDSSKVKVYDLYFSDEGWPDYAYLTSDSLTVDDEGMTISGIYPGMTVEQFVELVEPAPKAEMTVLDSAGNVVETGTLGEGYTVHVVSGDGNTEVTYRIEILKVGLDPLAEHGFRVYPNPVKDRLHVKGFSGDSQIVIRNVFGTTVKVLDGRDLRGDGSLAVQDLPAGIYFIYERTRDSQSEPVKFIKQ